MESLTEGAGGVDALNAGGGSRVEGASDGRTDGAAGVSGRGGAEGRTIAGLGVSARAGADERAVAGLGASERAGVDAAGAFSVGAGGGRSSPSFSQSSSMASVAGGIDNRFSGLALGSAAMST
jgi:hypothetical protein